MDGYRTVHAYLIRKGYDISCLTVHKYMNTEMQLFAISRKKKPAYEHGIAHKVYENKLNQDFHANAINQKWCTDFTYLFLTDGSKRYNCTIVDLLSPNKKDSSIEMIEQSGYLLLIAWMVDS